MSEPNPNTGQPNTPVPFLPDAELGNCKQHVLSLLAIKNNLLNKIEELEITLQADALTIPGNMLEEEILQRNEDLQEEVTNANSYFICQRKAFQSSQISKILRLSLGWGLNTKEQASAAPVDITKKMATLNLIENNHHLVKSYLEKLKVMENLKQTIKAKQKTSYELLCTTRKLNQEFTQFMKDVGIEPTNVQVAELRKVLNHFLHLKDVLAQLFQELIICSKVNWKTEPVLESFITSCGSTPKS